MKFAMLGIVLLLAGCVNREPTVVIKRVEVPVMVECVKESDLPESFILEGELLDKDSTIFDKAKAISIDRANLAKQNVILWAILQKCIAL